MVYTLDESDVIERARARGYDLVQRETDTGQLVWTWPRGDDPQPSFLTRRAACAYMADRLGRIAAST